MKIMGKLEEILEEENVECAEGRLGAERCGK